MCNCTCCQRRKRPASTTSPLAIEMLIHLYCKAGPLISRPFETWPPAQRSIVDQWVHAGYLHHTDDERLFVLTDRGRYYARRVIDAAKAVMV